MADNLPTDMPDTPFYEMVVRYLDNQLEAAEVARLEARLADDENSRAAFLDTCLQMALIRESPSECILSLCEAGETAAKVPTPALPFLGNAAHRTVGYFSSGWPVAYLVATVVLGIGLLIGGLTNVSRPGAVAKPWPLARKASPATEPPAQLVGRITGMVDCQWAKEGAEVRGQGPGIGNRPSLIPSPQSPVALGDRFALDSGLMEITYNSGARLILQGPATYEVESISGGYLVVGRLIARVEKRGERREETLVPSQRALTLTLSQRERGPTANPQSPIPNPPLSTLHDPLFTVRTPSATVTDLGTEFGVEVSKNGDTTSHVFRGLVRVQMLSRTGRPEGTARVLHEDESAEVTGSSDHRTIMIVSSGKPMASVREIPQRPSKTLDLVDVVAGGDGFSGRRDRGIDAASGQARATDVTPQQNPILGDGKYHRVTAIPFVDGVFIPHSDGGPVQLDSAGHAYAWFPATDNKTCGYVWAVKSDTVNEVNELEGINYTMGGHTMLEMHANKGVTFDLEAIRHANPGWQPRRFYAAVGNSERYSEKGHSVWADVWVFVDGDCRFRRREINRYNGAMRVVVPLGDKNRFLTLVATDGGNGYQQDHILFGDPRLELAPAEATAGSLPPRRAAEH